MEVILLEKIRNLGNLGDKVKVKAGYARNYLIPKKKAAPATVDNIKLFEQRRHELEKAANEALTDAKQRAVALLKLTISITANAGEEGKLYGSIGTVELARAIVEAGGEVKKSEIRLPMGALRHVGDYEIDVHLHSDVVITMPISIVAE